MQPTLSLVPTRSTRTRSRTANKATSGQRTAMRRALGGLGEAPVSLVVARLFKTDAAA